MNFRGRSIEEWRPLVEEWKASGMSMSAWCQEKEVPYSMFTYWRDKIDVARCTKRFIPIRDTPKPSTSIVCGDYRVEVSRSSDEALVIRCLRWMKQAS